MNATSIVETACEQALEIAPEKFPPDLHSNELLAGAPAWYPFEYRAWELGESVRQTLARHRKLRADPKVQSLLLRVILERNLRRGRQSFVFGLACKSAQPQARHIAPFLKDPDIQGQVLDALIKMRARGFDEKVKPLLDSPYKWIRSLARKYIHTLGTA